jgi:hypothetical protein
MDQQSIAELEARTKKGFRRVIVVTWIILGICLASFLARYILSIMNIDWTDKAFFLVYSVPVFIFGSLFLLMMYASRSTYSKDSNELLKGEYLVHWKYEEDEWIRFVTNEWKRLRKRSITVPSMFAALFIVIGLGSDLTTFVESGTLVIWVLLIMAMVSALALGYNHKSYRKNLLSEREVYIGKKGVYVHGQFASWEVSGARLGNVQFSPKDSSVIEFDIPTVGRFGSQPNILRVPVPSGAESEAKDVVQKFAERFQAKH